MLNNNNNKKIESWKDEAQYRNWSVTTSGAMMSIVLRVPPLDSKPHLSGWAHRQEPMDSTIVAKGWVKKNKRHNVRGEVRLGLGGIGVAISEYEESALNEILKELLNIFLEREKCYSLLPQKRNSDILGKSSLAPEHKTLLWFLILTFYTYA